MKRGEGGSGDGIVLGKQVQSQRAQVQRRGSISLETDDVGIGYEAYEMTNQ